MNAVKCNHESQLAKLAELFQQWRSYDCPYCEIQRQRDELTAMTLARDELKRALIALGDPNKALGLK